MTKPRVDSDGNRLAKRTPQVEADARHRDSRSHEHDRQEEQRYSEDLAHVLKNFADDDMGFLKVRRGLDTSELHLTWTFCNGPHYGTYVYVKVDYWQLDYGLSLLIEKRDEVYSGLRRSTPDKRNPSHS